MAKRRNSIDFDAVREIGLALPDVEQGQTSRGPSLKVAGRLLACPAIHSSAEPNSLMVRVSVNTRSRLLAADPRTYYLTEHYASYSAILVRLSRIRRDSLRDLLESARQYVAENASRRKRKGK